MTSSLGARGHASPPGTRQPHPPDELPNFSNELGFDDAEVDRQVAEYTAAAERERSLLMGDAAQGAKR